MSKYSMTTRGKRMYRWDVHPSSKGLSALQNGEGRSAAEQVWDKIVPHFPWDWDSYDSVMEWSQKPFIGKYFSARAQYMEYQENQRWLADYSKNTGIDLSNIKYPIRAGIYRGYTSPYSGLYSATESVVNLYGGSKLMRWI